MDNSKTTREEILRRWENSKAKKHQMVEKMKEMLNNKPEDRTEDKNC